MLLLLATVSLAALATPASLLLVVDRAADEAPTRVREALEAGRYAEAEALARRLLERAGALGPASENVPGAQALLAEALLLNGKSTTPDAVEAAQGALTATESRFGPADLKVASSQRLLGRILADRGDRTGARARFDAALAVSRTLLPRCAPALFDTLLDLTDLLLREGDRERSRESIDEALDCHRGHVAAADALSRARLRELQARLSRDEGHYEEAVPLAEEARSLRETAMPPSPGLVDTLNLLGELEWFLGRFERSRDWHRRALELAASLLREAHPAIATTLADLSLAEVALGNPAEALRLQLRALDITLAGRGEDHPETSDRLQNLANLYLDLDEYPRALDLYERVLKVTQQRFGTDSDEAANVFYNLGLLRVRMGEPNRARQELEKARSLWETLRGPDHPFVAQVLIVVAGVLLAQGELPEAEVRLERSAAIRRARPDTRPVELAWTLARLGIVRLRLGRTASARQLADQAYTLCATPAAQSQSTVVATTLGLIGDLDLALGRVTIASARFEMALRIFEGALGSEHPQTARLRARFAAALLRSGHAAAALREAAAAEATRRGHLQHTLRYLAEGQALSLAARPPDARDVLLSIAGARGATPKGVAQAFEAVVRSRALVLDEMASRHLVASPRDEVAGRIDALRQRVAYLIYRETDQSVDRRASALAVAGAELEALERRAAAESATVRAQKKEVAPDARLLAQRLPAGTGLVSYVRYRHTASGGPAGDVAGNDHYLAFVLRDAVSAPVVEELGAASAIDGAITAWRSELADINAIVARPGDSELRSRQRGAALRRLFWDPLLPHLRGLDLVLVVPDGEIGLVNFAALPASRNTYLAERGPTLHYLSSERDLLRIRHHAPAEPAPSLLAIGGPDYDAPAEGARLAPALPPTASRIAGGPSEPTTRAQCSASGQLLAFPFLPHAAAEASEVVSLWTKVAASEPALLLVGREATEAALKRGAQGRTVLHLATHGFFARPDCPSSGGTERGQGDDAQPRPPSVPNPLLNSGLALAGANRREGPEATDDGLLTAAEVAMLDLSSARTVVLSACASGLGPVQAGEGVISLQRAFVIAGAGTVVMSLWSVDDVHARLWMRAFYERRLARGLSMAEAVRQAQVQVLARLRRDRGAAPPGLWAPFVASGDWR